MMSTLQKANGLHTEDLRETIQCILEYLIPKDRRDRPPQTSQNCNRRTYGNGRRSGLYHRRNKASS